MNSDPFKPILVVAGPTASGKSALALDAAEEFTGTIINADSMQIYQGLPVLTAQPSPDEMARVPHRLYGALAPRERCSAGRWLRLAVPEIEAAWDEGRLPIVVGGTGLYLKALMGGISPLPDVPEALRAEAEALRKRLGADAFHAELAGVDPETAARVPPGDSQRMTRAYEVWLATGRSLTAWQAETPPGPVLEARFGVIALIPDRDQVYAACDARFGDMIEAGALDEVRALLELGLDPALPAMKAVGVPELGRHIRGEIPLTEAGDQARQATRNYAKRQFTWLRNQIPGAFEVSAQYSESFKGKIFSFIREFLLTAPL